MLQAAGGYRFQCVTCGAALIPPCSSQGAALLVLAAYVQAGQVHAVGSSDLTRCRLGCAECGPPKKGDF